MDAITRDEIGAEIGIKKSLKSATLIMGDIERFIETLRKNIEAHARLLLAICKSSRNYVEIEGAINNFINSMELLKKEAPFGDIERSIGNFIERLKKIQTNLIGKIKADMESRGSYTPLERVTEALGEIIKATNDTIIKDLGNEFEHVRGLEIALVKLSK